MALPLPLPADVRRARPRWLAIGAVLCVWLGWSAGAAEAGYTAQIVDDRLVVSGNGAGDQLALRLQAGAPTTLELDVGNNGSANFSFDRALFDRIVVNAGAGDDTVLVDQTNGVFTDTETTSLNGQDGSDVLAGGSGSQVLSGGRGNDTVDGNQGDDTANLGAGNDTVRWDPGDGNDLVNGQDGIDTLSFNGSGANENIDLSANGLRLRFSRDVAAIVIDAGTLERVSFEAFGGTDAVVINSLRQTPVTQVIVDLESAPGSGSGDAQADSIVFGGTTGADTITAGANGATMLATGLEYSVRVLHGEAANDRLAYNGPAADRVNVNGTAGADSLSVAPSPVVPYARVASPSFSTPVDVVGGATLAVRGLDGSDSLNSSGSLAALAIPLRFEGGSGNDQIGGSNGADRILGGTGNDVIDANQGNDNASGGDGADVFTWDPGDANDILRGDAGAKDVLAFNGSGANENIDIRSDGPRLLFSRDVAAVSLNVDAVERVLYHALGGTDAITVRNLAPTDVSGVTIDLESVLGGGVGDAQVDNVIVNGTSARDVFSIVASGGMAVVNGLAAHVRIDHPESANDELTVNGLGGNDSFSIGSGLPSLIGVTVNQ
jgi:Ca2+-binding RTX toxin-like protein